MKPNKDGNYLYAIAYEIVENERLRVHIDYTHAPNEAGARYNFFENKAGVDPRLIHVVGIAPVIGYKILDDKGSVLSV